MIFGEEFMKNDIKYKTIQEYREYQRIINEYNLQGCSIPSSGTNLFPTKQKFNNNDKTNTQRIITKSLK